MLNDAKEVCKISPMPEGISKLLDEFIECRLELIRRNENYNMQSEIDNVKAILTTGLFAAPSVCVTEQCQEGQSVLLC